jgi:hypothetical protein
VLPPKMGEGVLGFSLGATHSTGSSFFLGAATSAGASAARTRSDARPRVDRDAPEKPALRDARPEEAGAAAGATRAAHCACMRAAMVCGTRRL